MKIEETEIPEIEGWFRLVANEWVMNVKCRERLFRVVIMEMVEGS